MSIKEKVVKAKEYVKENKTEIAISVVGGCMLAAGFVVGWKGCLKSLGLNGDMNVIINKNVNKWFDHVNATYPGPGMMTIACQAFEKPLNVNDLGKLGKEFKELGVLDTDGFTHFLAIGGVMEK